MKMSNENGMYEIYEKFRDSSDFTMIGKPIGKGAIGEVRNIIYKNKTMAGKLIKRDQKEPSEEERYSLELRGQNIIKINKIYTKKIDDCFYDLIIMEKAILRDLGKLNEYFHQHNLLKTIYEPFNEKAGDSLLRFYAKQIINALELLDKNYFVHYDLKPENLLIQINLILKLSDFDLLRKEKNGSTIIPGGTHGFVTPEYYVDRNVSCDVARKQDYFALGSTLFFLKFGEQMIKFKKSNDNSVNVINEILALQQRIGSIKSGQLTDKDFIDFLVSLIEYIPKDRPSFEQIYKNKWLNKDIDNIYNISNTFENDEEKLIMELQKNDFFVQLENNGKENINFNNQKKGKSCRFRFKKKKKLEI